MLGFILLVAITALLLTLPTVQTKIAKYVVNNLNTKFDVNINVDQVAITIYGGVKLKKVLIKDYKNDTLIYSKTIYTNILDTKKLIDGDLLFGDLKLDNLVFNLVTHKGSNESNMDIFINKFGNKKQNLDGKHTLFNAKNVLIKNSKLSITDYNKETPKNLDLKKWNATLKDLDIYGPKVNINIVKMSFLDHRGLLVENLSTKFSYTKKKMVLNQLELYIGRAHV